MDEPFAHGRGLMHRIDPRARILAAVVFSASVAAMEQLAAAAAALGVALLLVMGAAPPIRPLGRRLASVSLFFGFLWLTTPLTMPGPTAWAWGPLHLSWPGIHLAAAVTLKGLAMILALIALVATMHVATFGHALCRLGVPTPVAMLLLFTYRQVFLLHQVWTRLKDAARLRGFVPRTDAHSYRTIATMLGLVVVRALDHAGRAHEAMLLRGFSGTLTSVTTFRASWQDVAFGLTMAAISAALTCMDIWGLPGR